VNGSTQIGNTLKLNGSVPFLGTFIGEILSTSGVLSLNKKSGTPDMNEDMLRVGINTNAPQKTLHVLTIFDDDPNVILPPPSATIRIEDRFISFTGGVNRSSAWDLSPVIGGENDVSKFTISAVPGGVFAGSALSTPLTLTADDKVGVNQRNPEANLHITTPNTVPGSPKNSIIVENSFGGKNFTVNDHGGVSAQYFEIFNKQIFEDNDIGTRNFYVDAQGFLFARKVQVTVGSIPDYVFEKDYDLMDLEDLKEYIKKNKHLPNVKSASDIKANENKMNVGEMQLKLLEKVEELTLYMLELKAENEKLKKMILNK